MNIFSSIQTNCTPFFNVKTNIVPSFIFPFQCTFKVYFWNNMLISLTDTLSCTRTKESQSQPQGSTTDNSALFTLQHSSLQHCGNATAKCKNMSLCSSSATVILTTCRIWLNDAINPTTTTYCNKKLNCECCYIDLIQFRRALTTVY